MKKFSKYIFSGIIVSSVLFSSIFCVSSLFNKNYTNNVYAEGETPFQVSVYNKSNEVISSNSFSNKSIGDNTYSYTSYKWKDTNYFSFTLPSNLNDKFDDTPANNSFKITVDWYLSEINNLNTFEVDHSATGTVKEENNFAKTTTFTIDNLYIDSLGTNSCSKIFSNTNEEKANFYDSNGGWGTYKFTLYANEEIISSLLIEIAPTKLSEIDINETPLLIDSKEMRSDYSLNSAFEFYINRSTTNNEENPFLYVKKSSLTWNIVGEGSDGTSYVLFPSQAKEGETSLLKKESSDDFSGTSIKFDFDISGKWDIQCIAEEGEIKIQSNILSVSTVQTIKTTYILLIIIGAIIVGAIILYVIIKLSKRKERIW